MSKLIYVSGEGRNLDVEYILVGEAPGAQEEIDRRPFVGSSGRLLRETFKDHKIYLTNVLKVRPENNRAPSLDEIKSWVGILHNEIIDIWNFNHRIKIVALGNVAHTALDLLNIEHYHIWHPSYVLRFNKHKEWQNSIKGIFKITEKL